MGGLVEDIQDLVQTQGLLLSNRGDHDPRRGTSDGARKQGLGEIDSVGIRGEFHHPLHPTRVGIAEEGGSRPFRTQEALREGHQLRHLDITPPEGDVSLARVLQDVHEGTGLGHLLGIGYPA